MDYFFHLLAVLMAVNLVAFVAVAVRYQYKAVVHKRHVVLGTEAAGMEPGQVGGGVLPVFDLRQLWHCVRSSCGLDQPVGIVSWSIAPQMSL
jgi:hypothetical protein